MIICNARSFQVSGKEFVPQEDRDALHSYVTQFLTDKHPHRTGNVCPFVPLALKHDAIQFVLPEVSEQASPRTLIRTTLDKFLLWRKMHAHIRGAMIIVFPRNFSVDVLRKAQQRELMRCIRHHCMSGVLYEDNNAPSLHSSEWYPLRTPVPIIVIRDLVVTDIVFVGKTPAYLFHKLIFLRNYFKAVRAAEKSHESRLIRSAHELHRRLVGWILGAGIFLSVLFWVILI